ncbi:RNA ligase family protein [Haloterrigena sp. SYSU A121-1]|uniref:RNA ligase family protein n=1 Tax=Haloterrigena gelatinilytica TaxID=2741724 RepID=A0A8J8GKA0_9EURY|nr:RNA ligase family protein [Haloterrigena gelatinilytica]NUB91156.1 RNA ligase family protein [Haloterrigena gelatinilytica]
MKHLPWSEEDAREQKWLDTVDDLLFSDGGMVVMTEKMDGSQACLTKDKVYARSHGHEAEHHSFDLLKKQHAEEYSDLIPEHLAIYGEWLYAKHSIKYTHLPDYFLAFGVYDRITDIWMDWKRVSEVCDIIGLGLVPVRYTGFWPMEQMQQEPEIGSYHGDTAEGYVLRYAGAFKHEDFDQAMAKCVRETMYRQMSTGNGRRSSGTNWLKISETHLRGIELTDEIETKAYHVHCQCPKDSLERISLLYHTHPDEQDWMTPKHCGDCDSDVEVDELVYRKDVEEEFLDKEGESTEN